MRVGDIEGDGRANPTPRPRAEPGKDSLAHLNIAKNTRIRVLEDGGRRGLVGLEGVVVQSIPGGVVVRLENDPLVTFRANQLGGFAKHTTAPRRHFRIGEVERVTDGSDNG